MITESNKAVFSRRREIEKRNELKVALNLTEDVFDKIFSLTATVKRGECKKEVGEIVYGGVGWGYGERSDGVRNVYQFIGGAEIPLGPYFRIGGAYHYIRSLKKNDDDQFHPLKAQVFMGRLTVNF